MWVYIVEPHKNQTNKATKHNTLTGQAQQFLVFRVTLCVVGFLQLLQWRKMVFKRNTIFAMVKVDCAPKSIFLHGRRGFVNQKPFFHGAGLISNQQPSFPMERDDFPTKQHDFSMGKIGARPRRRTNNVQ